MTRTTDINMNETRQDLFCLVTANSTVRNKLLLRKSSTKKIPSFRILTSENQRMSSDGEITTSLSVFCPTLEVSKK